MKRIGYWIVVLAIISSSCGVSRKAVDIQPTSYDIVQVHLRDGDPAVLLEDLDTYPEFKDEIESKLFKWIDYRPFSYGQLKRLSELSEDDYSASVFFDSLLVARQESIYELLSDMGIDDVGKYYHDNYADQDFLRSLMLETYFQDTENQDYYTLKAIYSAFRGTNLASYISPVYSARRKELLDIILSDFKDLFNAEKELLSNMESGIREQLEAYIQEGVVNITSEFSERVDRGLIKRTFKRKDIDNYTIQEYAAKLISENLDQEYMTKMISTPLFDYLSGSMRLREEMLSDYQEDANVCDKYYVPMDLLSEFGLNMSVSNDKATQIQTIKTTNEVVSVASIALSFSPAGWLAWVGRAFDVVDLYNGFTEDSKIKTMMESFSSSLYTDVEKSVGQYLDSLFSEVSNKRKETELYIIRRINEDF